MSHIEVDIERQEGFTLIELVVSAGIITTILISTFYLYSAGAKSYGIFEDQLFIQQNVRQSMMWLSVNIRQAKRVEIISEDKIKVVMYSDEAITFYLKNDMLYREKNTGVNPIAELNFVQFSQPSEKKYIEIELGAEKNYHVYRAKIKVTPMGYTKLNENHF